MRYFKGTMHARRGTTSFTSTTAGRNLKCILKINETKFIKKRFFLEIGTAVLNYSEEFLFWRHVGPGSGRSKQLHVVWDSDFNIKRQVCHLKSKVLQFVFIYA